MSRKTTEERFNEKVRVMKWGCHEWFGTLDNGYGVFHLSNPRRTIRAHAYVWQIVYGKPPAGFLVHHKCHNKRCVNLQHLQLMERGEHNKEFGHAAYAKLTQTHCIHGHEFTVENTFVDRNGTRHCKECNKLRGQERRRKAVALRVESVVT